MATLKVPDAQKANLKSPSKVMRQSLQKQGSGTDLVASKTNIQSRSRNKLASQSQARIRRESSRNKYDDGDDGEEWEAKDPVRPDDQLQLSEAELKQEFTRLINANNPHAPHNVVRFSFKEREFRQTATVEQTVFHLTLDGNLVPSDSDEGRRQKARRSRASKADGGSQTGSKTDLKVPSITNISIAVPVTGVAAGADEDEDAGPVEKKVLRNQFNFSERASQTFNQTIKERGAQTEPPPRAVFGATATQWAIYDAYVADQARQAALKEKKSAPKKEGAKEKATEVSEAHTGSDDSSPWAAAAKIVPLTDAKKLERMVNQNTFDDVLQDLFYWEDPSDEFKPAEGSLLPLWRMVSEVAKKRAVTALAWSPQYADLFAVGYGSYDYTRPGPGTVAVFSLKNPSHPEFEFDTPHGVMCLDFHPKQSDLLVVGLYDGSVCVHRLCYGGGIGTPLYASTPKTGKHSDPVWQIKWRAGEEDGAYTFSSVSSDGRVVAWTIVKNQLQHSDMFLLSADATATPTATTAAASTSVEPSVFAKSCGTCMAFNPSNPGQYLVGTEEGAIRSCSTAYGSKYLMSYLSHGMAVYNVAWNTFHPRVFISCGADWCVKVWDSNSPTPIFSFDLGSAVGDVAWAPYSSCVFAAVTTSGQVHVFDLQQNKYEPLCVQSVARKGHLTHIAFNSKLPLLVVGDDRGSVHSLKLSPNLRRILKDKKAQQPENQAAALEKILDSVKDLPDN